MEKPKLLISACLLGIPCRYDGRSVQKIDDETLRALLRRYELIPVCPEIYGGLPTPRIPSERVGDRVLTEDGRDVTGAYLRGAESTLATARLLGAKKALLKEKSPSCGKGRIYDGTHTGRLTDGNGITTDLLLANEIFVYGESEIPDIL